MRTSDLPPKSKPMGVRPQDIQVWQHPVLANAIEVLEVFSIEPGDGKLAASLALTSNHLAQHVKTDSKTAESVQMERLMATRDRSLAWLQNEVSSAAYAEDPTKSTNQVEKSLNCTLLLLCAQILHVELPSKTEEKACRYVEYMASQRWPRDDLLPFVVSYLKNTRDLATNAKGHLLEQADHWRLNGDVQGISFILIRCGNELGVVKRDELVATMKARLSEASEDMSRKAWALLAFSKIEEIQKPELDGLAEAILDELAKDRFVNNEITPTVRLINQFPFSSPEEISHRVDSLRQRGYAPAERIKQVSEDGVLIDLFTTSSEDTWSFALHSTQVAFAVYALIATGYYEIAGYPAQYRQQLKELAQERLDLQMKRAVTIPVNFVKWYNVFAVIVWLQIGAIVGAIIGEALGKSWLYFGGAGMISAALSAIFSIRRNKFVIVDMPGMIAKWLEGLIGAIGKK